MTARDSALVRIGTRLAREAFAAREEPPVIPFTESALAAGLTRAAEEGNRLLPERVTRMVNFKLRLGDNTLEFSGDDERIATSLISQFFAASQAVIQQRIDGLSERLETSSGALEKDVQDATRPQP